MHFIQREGEDKCYGQMSAREAIAEYLQHGFPHGNVTRQVLSTSQLWLNTYGMVSTMEMYLEGTVNLAADIVMNKFIRMGCNGN